MSEENKMAEKSNAELKETISKLQSEIADLKKSSEIVIAPDNEK